MVGEMLAVIDMFGANRYCINRLKDNTIFSRDGNEYIILRVKDFAVKLCNINTWEETSWISVPDFQKWYEETEYYLDYSNEDKCDYCGCHTEFYREEEKGKCCPKCFSKLVGITEEEVYRNID